MKKTVKIYIDEGKTPVQELVPPANFTLDTSQLADGPHTLSITATSSNGTVGIRKVNFTVRNGPEIILNGLKENETVNDQLDLSVNAYGSEKRESFIVAGSETPRAVPAWLWVLIICFVSWAIFYLISNWS